jgi:hypothetical protein
MCYRRYGIDRLAYTSVVKTRNFTIVRNRVGLSNWFDIKHIISASNQIASLDQLSSIEIKN